MSNSKEKLSKISTEQSSQWRENAKYRRNNRVWLKKSAIVAIKVLDALKTQHLSQKDLADRMGISPQQINKIVKGQENLTLETISNLETALGIEIIEGVSIHNKSGA